MKSTIHYEVGSELSDIDIEKVSGGTVTAGITVAVYQEDLNEAGSGPNTHNWQPVASFMETLG